MAFDRAKTSFQSVEEKFRRLFSLAGTIGASFQPEIRPVVLAGDLDSPGVASFRGRHWAWVSDVQNPLASGVIGVKFGSDVIIHRVAAHFLAFGAARSEAYLFPPELEATAPSVALATVAGTWIDQRNATVDNPPLLSRAAQAAGSAVNFTVANRIAAFSQQGLGPPQLDVQIHAPGGSALYFNTALAAGVSAVFAVYGRMF